MKLHSTFLFVGMLLLISMLSFSDVLFSPSIVHSSTHWQFPDRHYRVAISVHAKEVARTDRTVDVFMDFENLLNDSGTTGSFAADSLRVVEVDTNGDVLDDAVPFQFDNGLEPNNAVGTLVFLPSGTSAADTTRYFHVYFDTTGIFTAAPPIEERVKVSVVPNYRGQESFKIVTHDPDGKLNTTFYYHKQGAGFASMIDRDGNDWINFYPTQSSQSGGEYRGIPNLGQVFHPGYTADAGNQQGSTSTIIDQGPLRLSIRSVSNDNQTEAIWHIYPTYATMNLVRHPDGINYWFLYEGTPGGNLDYTGVDQDYVGRSDGTRNDVSESWESTLNPEWVYFGDTDLNRILYVAHTSNDNLRDSYRYQYNSDQSRPSDSNDNGAMTVFGFGRPLEFERLMTANDTTFMIGFAETSQFASAAAVINSVYQELEVTISEAELQDGFTPPLLTSTPTSSPTSTPTTPAVGYSIQLDNFNSLSLNTNIWTFINPHNDATVTLNGTTASIAVPAGTAHDVWSDGNYAPRLMQSVADEDFDIEVKFDTLPSGAYALQGILVEADATNFLRFDIYSDGSNRQLFAASFDNGAPTVWGSQVLNINAPFYLRVKRVGDTWTQSYSTDGIIWQDGASFEHPLVVTKVGVFAGNAGVDPPAFTSVIDYFAISSLVAPGQFTHTPTPTSTMTPTATPTDEPDPTLTSTATPTPTATPTDESDPTPTATPTPDPDAGEVPTMTPTPKLPATTGKVYLPLIIAGAAPVPIGTPTATHTATATPVPVPRTFQSDDFNALSLNTDLWTFIDPRGDSSLEMNGTNALISVPDGVEHNIWTDGNDAPRLVQTISDTDFEVEVKFEAALGSGYTAQGIVVEADPNHFLRFDTYSDGNTARLFAAIIANGGGDIQFNEPVPNSVPFFLRVKREGNTWTQTYSEDGETWVTGATFEYELVVDTVGVFVSNSGASPAFTGSIDYVFNTAAPIDPEDADLSLDMVPPLIHNVVYTTTASTLQIQWQTNKLSTGWVEYGKPTAAYNLKTVETEAAMHHSAVISDLQPLTFYRFRMTAVSLNKKGTYSEDFFIRTGTPASDKPIIDVWYGSEQPFGQHGTPQKWVNILGNVSDPDGVESLVYALNGGSISELSFTPDRRRLVTEGDFVIEIDYTELLDGMNTVVMTATDTLGQQAVQDVQITYTSGKTWPIPYTIDWNTTDSIQDVAQIVDGLWFQVEDGIRVAIPGYDRLIAIGDISWTDYELTVPITIHQWYPDLEDEGVDPGVGIILRWDGHEAWSGVQPRQGWHPLGALGWYRYKMLEMIGGKGDTLQLVAEPTLQPGIRYMMKMRVTSRASQTSWYQLKVWEDGTSEPEAWHMEVGGEIGELSQGSALLVAHKVEATFGNVSIKPLSGQ